MSRWYRAPEIILQEPEYDFSADNWGIGCILGEMLWFAMKNAGRNTTKDRTVFPGTSCFPLSPCDEMQAAGDSAENIVS